MTTRLEAILGLNPEIAVQKSARTIFRLKTLIFMSVSPFTFFCNKIENLNGLVVAFF